MSYSSNMPPGKPLMLFVTITFALPRTGAASIYRSLAIHPLAIWIGACIVILGALVALIRFRQKQHQPPLPAIYLARHCKTDWNREGRVQGTMDIELSAEGAHDAELNLSAIRNLGIQRIICSPAKRAMQTATIYAQGLGVPLQSSPRLSELDHGEWEGQRIEDLLNLPNSPFERWMTDPSAVLIPGSSETCIYGSTAHSGRHSRDSFDLQW